MPLKKESNPIRNKKNQSNFSLQALSTGAVASFVAAITLSQLPIPVQAKGRRATAPAAAAASGGSAPVMNPANMSPLDHNNKAVEYGQKGMWAQAISEHEIALNGDPENTQFKTNLSGALLRYGQALAAKSNWNQAIHEFREALYIDPNNADAANNLDHCIQAQHRDPSQHLKMGDELEIEGNYPEAIVEYRRNVRADDGGPAAAALARALIKQGSNTPSRLVEGYSMMVVAVGKSWDPSQQNDLAACHQRLGDILKEYAFVAKNDNRMEPALKRLSNASVEYRRAVQLNPGNTDAIRSLVEVAREAVAIKPSFDNHLMLGSAYLLLGDLDRAKQEYEACNKLDPNSESLNLARKAFHWAIASSTLHVDLLPNTVIKAEEQLKKNPNDPVWLYIWGMAKQQQGEREMAMKAYLKALSLNPTLPKLKERINAMNGGPPVGSSPATPGKPGDKVPSTVPGANGAPTPPAVPTVDPTRVAKLAEIQAKMRANDLEGALKDANDIAMADTSCGEAWFDIATIQQKKGNLDEASSSFRQAKLLKFPGAAEAGRQLDIMRVQPQIEEADKQMAANNFVSAAGTLREAIGLAPTLSILHKKLADCLDKLGDAKEAGRERKKAAELEKGD
ncbi:MAG: tetratricopeptide repeat protein [Candidatus Obscuribacterales bacterium]|nr:tetratricopeptide repeat protein [Candidatus Obscuribacterales bacterium]